MDTETSAAERAQLEVEAVADRHRDQPFTRRSWTLARQLVRRRPVLSVFLLAFAARVAFAVGYVLATDAVIIPDEIQYIYLGEVAAEGRLTPDVWAGYGRSLFDSTWAFTAPLSWIFWLLWPWRFFGQLLSALFGAATAALATRIGLAAFPRRAAVAGGALVAVLPSQVLFSSVVLRESEVWFGLAGLALCSLLAAQARTLGRLTASLAGAVAFGLILGNLRDQTFLVAVWALPIAAVVGARRLWGTRLAGTVAIAAALPLICGLGWAGWSLVEQARGRLGTTRTYMSMNAESAFVPTTTIAVPRGPDGGDAGDSGGSGGDQTFTGGSGPTAIVERPAPEVGDHRVITSSSGAAYAVEESVSANLAAIPPGLVATVLRPLPWESGDGITLLFARLENLAWYALYVLAGVGWWANRRQWRLFSFPIVAGAAVLAVAALTQGNVGTAFRHRGQLLWAFAVPAAYGAEVAWTAVRRRVSTAPAGPSA